MEKILKVEELLMFVLGIFLFSQLDFRWWWFLVLILTPDFSMLGYMFNPKIGAYAYNIVHHKGVAIALYLLGIYLQNEILQLTGIILFAHASMDRIMGYGLKHTDSFNNTHLGKIGKS